MKVLSIIAAATVALAAVFGVAPARAGTIATFTVDGEYSFSTGTTGGTTVSMGGNWAAEILSPVPNTIMDVSYGARVSLISNGAPSPLTWEGTVGPAPRNMFDDLTNIGPIIGFLVTNAGVPQNFGLGTLTYNGTLNPGSTPTNAFGTWNISATTFMPAGDIPVAALVNPFLQNTILGSAIPQGFAFPNNDNGSFEVRLSASVSPVPLPAGGLLLATALGGVAVIRVRRKRAA